jgi:hypothetical protein
MIWKWYMILNHIIILTIWYKRYYIIFLANDMILNQKINDISNVWLKRGSRYFILNLVSHWGFARETTVTGKCTFSRHGDKVKGVSPLLKSEFWQRKSSPRRFGSRVCQMVWEWASGNISAQNRKIFNNYTTGQNNHVSKSDIGHILFWGYYIISGPYRRCLFRKKF